MILKIERFQATCEACGWTGDLFSYEYKAEYSERWHNAGCRVRIEKAEEDAWKAYQTSWVREDEARAERQAAWEVWKASWRVKEGLDLL